MPERTNNNAIGNLVINDHLDFTNVFIIIVKNNTTSDSSTKIKSKSNKKLNTEPIIGSIKSGTIVNILVSDLCDIKK